MQNHSIAMQQKMLSNEPQTVHKALAFLKMCIVLAQNIWDANQNPVESE